MNKTMMAAVLALVVGAVGGFYGGMMYQQKNVASTAAGGAGRFSGRGTGMMRNGMNAVTGTVTKADDTSLTVELRDGSSKVVFLDAKTTFNKSTEAAKTDLKVGDRIAVFGTANSDGSETAQSVSINPVFRGGGPGSTPSAQQ